MKKLTLKFSSEPKIAAVLQKVETLKEKSTKVAKLPAKPTLKAKTSSVNKPKAKVDAKTKLGNKKIKYPADVEEFFQILKILNKHNAEVFPLKGPRPSLKKGISKDIVELTGKPSTRIRYFMKWYTFSKLYSDHHKAGVPRLDLNGKVVEHVTEIEANHKAEFLKQIHVNIEPNSICSG
jgi:hypothetical protein